MVRDGGTRWGRYLLELVFLCLLVFAGFRCLSVQLLGCELYGSVFGKAGGARREAGWRR